MLPDLFCYKPGQSAGKQHAFTSMPNDEGDERMSHNGGGGEGSNGASLQRTGAAARAGRGGGRGAGLASIATDRPIFTLSVAADLLGLHPRTLRIYEEKGLVVPARTDGNRRRYSQNDIQRFQFIRTLTQRGVNLEGVRIILDMADELTNLGGNPSEVIEKNLQSPALNEP
jgi:MerR family transcriptional regulator/heat shock protein HspR